MKEVTVEKCACGHPMCKTYWLVGIGTFVQGSGFTWDEATLIAKLLNEATKDEHTTSNKG